MTLFSKSVCTIVRVGR